VAAFLEGGLVSIRERRFHRRQDRVRRNRRNVVKHRAADVGKIGKVSQQSALCQPSLDDDPGFLSGVEIAEPRKGLKPPVWRTLNELCGERGARLICREVRVNLAYRWFCKLGILTGCNLPKIRQSREPGLSIINEKAVGT
jgi:hypothetical protein